MKLHLATALGALLLCLAGPALGQMPKGPGGPIDVMPMPKAFDLSMNKRVVGPVVAGQTATFALEVTNTGPTTVTGAMGIQVIDPLPAGFSGPMTGFGSSWACGQVGASLICNWTGGPVPPGATFPPITMTAVAGSGDSYRQCARVRITRGKDQHPGNDQDCVDGRIERPQGRRYDVRIRKDGPATVPIGQTATFTLQVTNQGPSPVGASVGLTVSDLVPVNFTNVTANGVGWTCILAGSQPTQVTCTYNGSQVNAGFQFPVITITGLLEKEGPWLNCAEVDFRKAEDSNPRDNRDCAEGSAGPGGKKGYDLGIRKTYKPPSKPGGPATFMLYPYNNGPSAVSGSTGVQVTDTLPPNFQPPITGVGTNWTCSTNGGPPWTVVCDYIGPSVGPGSLPPIEILAAVREPGRFENCAEILLREERDLKPRDNRSCVGGEVSGGGGKKPDINITKTALKQPWAWPSGTGVYQFRITNVGDTPVPAGHTFTLTENLPAGMVLISTPNAWSCSPGAGTVGAATVTCTYVSTAALNPTAFIQFDMTVGFTDKKEPQYVNCTSVAVFDRDRPWAEVNMRNNTDCEPVEVRPTPKVADLKIDKQGQPPIMVGQSMTFVLGVTNKGPDSVNAGSGITVTDVLPGLFSPPVTVTAPDWNCVPSGLSVSCTYVGSGSFGQGDDLPPITLSAVATSAGQTENCAQVAIPGDPVAGNNSDCADVVVRPSAPTMNLAVSKSVYGTWLPQGGDFQIDVTNTSGVAIPAGTTVTVTDTLPPGMRFDGDQGPFSCTPVGAVGPATVTCTATLGVPLGAGQSLTGYLTMALMLPVGPSYQNCVSLSASVAETTLADNSDCATIIPVASPASLAIEKVVEQDCSGTYPYTACKFMIRIFNTGSTVYTGPLTFTDTVTGPSGMTIGGVSLALPLPPGWSCSGSQPATCSITTATIPVNGHITIPLYMTINGAIPPQQNCAVLTAPVSAQSCVEMGSTHFDLGLTSSIVETDLALNGATFEFFVSSTPTLANGAQLVFNGSVITSATFVPPALAPVAVSGTPLWSCVGPWSGFICTLNVTSGAWSGGVIPLRLKVYYNTLHVGLPVTFTGQIQMNGNADPVQSNNSTTVTTVLP
ncbi:MAG: DUF11 domain-containing protein [Caulobacter sp.]|nr:DUF11 domain-containing protein [Caulobacter sp.]